MRTKFSNNSFISLVSYKNQNHGALRAVLVMLLFTLGIGNAWGGTAYTRGRAFLKEGCPTGSGKVYVGGGGKSSTPGTYTQLNSYDTPVTDEKAEAQATRTYYFYAQANSGYKFTGWYKKNTDDTYTLVTTETSCSGSVTSGKDPSSGSSYKDIDRYAEFIKIVHYSFIVPEHGSYTITNNGVEVENYATIEAEGVVHLVSLPADGYRFAGWYTTTDGGVTKNYFSFDPETDLSFSDDATVGVDFRLDNGNALFYVVNGGMHDNLTTAITEASSISPKVVTVAQDGHLASGNYTIPSGVTLLVQNNKSYDVQTKPELVKSASSLFVYRRLTMLEGANITCSGTICIAGKQVCLGGGNASGYVTGGCGVIDMSAGGHIELNNGANLYAWGFITGQDVNQGNNTSGVGTIVANSGSKVWEDFAVGDWRGGTACSNIQGSNFFPFQSYFIQNIEVPLTIKYGAVDNCYASVSGDGKYLQLSATMIGTTDALFKLASGGEVRKWYDATTDLMCFELSGTANLDAVVVKGLPAIGTISSADYYLPISSNMHIILTNSNVTISKPMTVQPGAKIEVKSDANITISSNVFLYDKEEWGPYAGPSYYFHNYGNGILTAHKNRGNGKSKELLDDAQIIVDGQLSITGKLYSTASGADVMGNGGGHVVFSALPSSSTTIDAFTSNGDAVSGGVTVNTANLHNEDESYTKAIASTTFHNVHGRWFKFGNQNEKANHTYDFTYISSGAVSGTGGTNSTTEAVYAPDKTGLEVGMKWCNVVQDGTCSNIFNATQALNETPASDIRYTYPSSEWLQLLRTETEDVYGGSDNSLYAVDGCAVNSLGSVDENCLYTIDGVKKALVDGHFVALAKNDDDEAFHNTADAEDYYISFEGCTWHPATKEVEEKAYTVEGGIYIWYSGDWKLVEREAPYFFDYNDQNVKRYYEYENGAWVLATPCVSVTDVLETRYFYFINEAFTVANGKKNTTITLLKDIPTITTALTYSAKNTTCTLDLNGHVLPGTVSSMLTINAPGSTFTITDNTTEKEGRIQLTVADNARRYAVNLTSGSLILDAGIISAVNTLAYNSSSAKATQSCGLIVKPGMTFTMNGGRVEALATYNPWGIYVEGSTSTGGTITINGGTVHAESTQVSSPYGIYGYGTWNINSGATIEAVAKTTSACALYVEATTSKYFGTLNLNGGTINATSTTKTATGIFVNGVYIFTKTTPNAISSTYRAVATITGGTVNVSTLGTTDAYGIQSRGTTTISNVIVNVTPKTTTGTGVWVQDGTTTINSGTFTVNATTTAKGIYANGLTPDDKTGRPYNPNVIVYGGTFNVTATTSTPAYGIHVDCDKRNITSTASGYYAGVYSSVPTVTIHGGEFNVHSTTKEAWGAYVARNYLMETGTNNVAAWYRPTLTINDGTFVVTTGSSSNAEAIRSYGIAHVNGGDFTATAKTTYAYGFRVMDGIGTTSGNPKFTIKATTTNAYGAVADVSQPGEKTGLPCQGDLTIGGGTFDVNATTSDAYGLYVNASGRVVTSTADGYYPGDYSSIGKATVNGGTFTVTTKTLNAIGAYVKRDIQANRYVTYGELTINDGNFTVATSVHTKSKIVAGVMTYGPTTINGGTFDVTAANSSTAANANTAYGVYALDDETTISGSPEFTVKSYSGAYGVTAQADKANATTGLTYNSHMTINGGTYNVSTTGTTTACGAYAAAPAPLVIASGDYAGDYYSTAELTVNGGTFNVVAKTTTAIGAMSGRNYISANTMPNTYSNFNYGVLNINGGTFNVSTLGTTTAEGVRSHGTTTISGGTFNVTPKTTTAFGVRVFAGTTTINDDTEIPTFTVTATESAFGMRVGEQPADKTGLTYNGTAIINAGSFTVEATSTGSAYGLYAYANKRKVTSTASGNYIGAYASAGNITANGGEFNVKATTNAYGIAATARSGYAAFTQSSVTYPAAYATPQVTINGGKFKMESTTDANATAYATNTSAAAADYGISGGYYSHNTNLSKYAVSPKKVLTLRESHALYPEGYRYTVGQGGTVTWKNGAITLLTEDYLQGETPEYTGETPTKAETDEYTYTHNGWDPTIAEMGNSNATYSATYSSTPRSYTLTWETDGDALTGTYTSGLVPYGTTIVAPNTPTKTGCTFAGWTPTVAPTMPAANTTYTATWASTEQTYEYYDESEGAWKSVSAASAPTPASSYDDEDYHYVYDGYYDDLGGGVHRAHYSSSEREYGTPLDIVDWTADKIVVNANGLKAAEGGTAWKIKYDGDYVYNKNTRTTDRRLLITRVSETPDSYIVLKLKGTGGVERRNKYLVPHIYDDASATLSDTEETSVVYVHTGATLTVDANTTIKDLYVSPGANVVVSNGNTLTISGKLVLRTLPWQSAAIEGDVDAAQTFYTRIAPNGLEIDARNGKTTYTSSPYYQLALPYECNIADVRLSDGSTPEYNKTWLLKSYSESSRATKGATENNWVAVSNKDTDTKIKAHTGYEFYSNSTYYREYYFPVTPTDNKTVTVDRSEGDNTNAGWNMICSPLMSNHQKNPHPEDITVSWLNEEGKYDQSMPDVIPPAIPFFYQAAVDKEEISFAGTNVTPSLAPRRRIAAADEPTRIQWIRLDVKDAKGEGDETNIYSHPTRYEQYYQTGIDVAKQSLTAARARLYSSHAYGDMAFAGVSDELFEQGVALTLYSPAAQELTFSLRQNEWLNRLQYVWIIDFETGAMIDLLSSDYTAEVTEGTTYGRFYISGRFRTPQIATDIEPTSDSSLKGRAQKVLIEEKIYIMVGDKLYDATGKLVKGK